MAEAAVTLNPPEGHSVVTVPDGYDPYIFQKWDAQPKVGAKLVYDNEDGTTELNDEPNLVGTDSDTLELYYVDPDTGEWTYAPITWANLPAAGDDSEPDPDPEPDPGPGAAAFVLVPPDGHTFQNGKVLPDGLTYDGSDYFGADGTYEVYDVSSTGEWTYQLVTVQDAEDPAIPKTPANLATANITSTSARFSWEQG